LNLGVLPSLGGGLSTLAKTGQHGRFVNYYLRSYVRDFSCVRYFSYHRESLRDYTSDPRILERAQIVRAPANVSPYRYALTMPLAAGEQLRQCNILRVMQLTGAIPALAARLRWGIPFVVTYGYRYARFAAVEKRWRAWFFLTVLEPIVLLAARAVIVTTPELYEHVSRTVPSKRVHLIPNGVDTELFSPGLPRTVHTDGPVNAIFVGRMEPQKNLVALIEALAMLRRELDIRLTLIGQGPLQPALAQQSAELDVPVTFVGTVPHERLPEYLRKADLFVLPSLIEGHPKALLEAMSIGIPCVGTNVPGTRDLLSDEETGILCSSTEPEALLQGLRRCLRDQDKARHLGNTARLWIQERFSLSALLEKEMAVLQTVAWEHQAETEKR
jgi:glycosyltransferase involved in cell wall biosynthesis